MPAELARQEVDGMGFDLSMTLQSPAGFRASLPKLLFLSRNQIRIYKFLTVHKSCSFRRAKRDYGQRSYRFSTPVLSSG